MPVHVDPALPIHPLTIADVDAMVAAGILAADARVELIDGVLVEKMGQGEQHSRAVRRLTMLLVPIAAAQGLQVSPQCPMDVDSDYSLPEPDMAVVPEPERGRRAPGEAVLAIEVSVSSRRVDLGRKAGLYAEAGIPEYWVLDVERRTLVVHTGPAAGGYGQIAMHGEQARVTATRLPFTVLVADLL